MITILYKCFMELMFEIKDVVEVHFNTGMQAHQILYSVCSHSLHLPFPSHQFFFGTRTRNGHIRARSRR